MYNLIIDYSILIDFFLNKPKDIIEGGEVQDHDYWNSFYSFLKFGSNIEVINYQEGSSPLKILELLTSGRKDSFIKLNSNFKKPHKSKFVINNLYTLYFLNEEDEKEIIKYRKNNVCVFAFKYDYPKVWESLSLINQKTSFPVRKETKLGIKKWGDFERYLINISDVILIDNFILDNEIIEYNVVKIIELIKNSKVENQNVTIISYQGDKFKSPLNKRVEKLKDLLKLKNIDCNLKVIFTQVKSKEHDRQLIFNNFRIKSGDSFNFFNSKGDIISKGTEVDILPLVDLNNLINTSVILDKIKKIELSLPRENIFGSCKNRFIEYD